MAKKAVHPIGQKFGMLTITGISHYTDNWMVAYSATCDCGKTDHVVLRSTLYHPNRNTRSCGCIRKTHGKSGSDTYSVWDHMKQRCLNPNNSRYHQYGGRGIGICERWMSYENFLEDMGERPSKEFSIDRIDNDKGYSPDNCRWATATQQMRNQSIKSTNKSGVRGVHLSSRGNRWIAQIAVNKKTKHLGCFLTKEEAIAARKKAEKEMWC